jgi:hypothetical protein
MAYLITSGRFYGPPGGTVSTYAAGTLTPLATYTTQGGGTANPTTITIPSSGYVSIFGAPSTSYRFIVKDSTGATVYDEPNLTPPSDASSASALEAELAGTASGQGAEMIGYQPSGTAAIARTVDAVLSDLEPLASSFTTLAAAAASGAVALVIPPGNYSAPANVSFPMPVSIPSSGVTITPATGVTVTFAGGFTAERHRCFNTSAAGSAIAFDAGKTTRGYPEWWGAVTSTSAPAAGVQTLTTSAINAAVIALHTTEGAAGSYYTNGRILIEIQGHGFEGRGCTTYNGTNGDTTRILCTSSSSDIIQLGPDTYPGAINSMPQGIFLRGVYVCRDTRPTISSDCAGVVVRNALHARMDFVKSTESMRSFYFHQTVSGHFNYCYANRSLAGASTGTDYWYGFYAYGDNSTSGWGMPGGNASLYLNRCQAGCNIASLQSGNSSGFYFDLKYTDIFMDRCESGDCNVGLNFQGTSATGDDTNNQDVTIRGCVMDSSKQFSLFIKNASEGATMDVSDLYCGPSSGATAAVYIQDSKGCVTFTGGQILLGSAAGTKGMVIDASTGVSVHGTKIVAGTTTGIQLASATSCRIEATLKNRGNSGGAAIQLTGTNTDNIISPLVFGKTEAFTYGIQCVGTGDARNEYHCTGIVYGNVFGRKLDRNGTNITATGLSGTNLVSGVMT